MWFETAFNTTVFHTIIQKPGNPVAGQIEEVPAVAKACRVPEQDTVERYLSRFNQGEKESAENVTLD